MTYSFGFDQGDVTRVKAIGVVGPVHVEEAAGVGSSSSSMYAEVGEVASVSGS